jgi:hypothetical protein
MNGGKHTRAPLIHSGSGVAAGACHGTQQQVEDGAGQRFSHNGQYPQTRCRCVQQSARGARCQRRCR